MTKAQHEEAIDDLMVELLTDADVLERMMIRAVNNVFDERDRILEIAGNSIDVERLIESANDTASEYFDVFKCIAEAYCKANPDCENFGGNCHYVGNVLKVEEKL